jgi:hypothetical protein
MTDSSAFVVTIPAIELRIRDGAGAAALGAETGTPFRLMDATGKILGVFPKNPNDQRR